MSDPDFGGLKADGRRRRAEREAEKSARRAGISEAERAARAEADVAAKARARAQRKAASAAHDAEQRRRQAEFKEQSAKSQAVAGGATTLWRLTHLQVLGLRAEQDNASDIRRAHRRLALRYHPDKNTSGDAPAMFRKIQAAYEALTAKPE
jgi:membrane protein involved in colicin uptake